jgi:hypothetical protein
MDSFENVVATILQRQGYWTLTSVKVELTKVEKRAIRRHCSPRWELDIVAYSGRRNELLVVECKSFLDSPGVECGAFDGTKPAKAMRYKLFCDATLRRVVLRRLRRQLVKAGFCAQKPKVKLCLAAGRIRGDENWLRSHFERKGWGLFGPSDIHRELKKLCDAGYENSVAAVVTKILLRSTKPTGSKAVIDAAV